MAAPSPAAKPGNANPKNGANGGTNGHANGGNAGHGATHRGAPAPVDPGPRDPDFSTLPPGIAASLARLAGGPSPPSAPPAPDKPPKKD